MIDTAVPHVITMYVSYMKAKEMDYRFEPTQAA